MLEDIFMEFERLFQEIESYLIAKIPKLIIALLVVGIFYFILKKLKSAIQGKIRGVIEDPLVAGFFERFYYLFKWILLTIIFLSVIGKTSLITSILGAAGVSAFIIGFAFKDLGENFLAGIMLAFKRPFRLGDIIQSNNIKGVMKDINFRETHLKTFDGQDVYIPNAQLLKNPLFNYTIDGFMRFDIAFTVDYDSDIERAKDVILEEANKLSDVLSDKKAFVIVESADAPKVTIRLYYWMDSFNRSMSQGDLQSTIIVNCINRFKSLNISSPNPSIKVISE